MTITEIRIRRTYFTGRLRAVVSVVLDGSHRDIIHPIGETSRKALETAVLGAYRNCVADYRLCA